MRMMNWVRLAMTILQTEFPSYSICGNLARSFRIVPDMKSMPAENRRSLKQLSRTWDMDKETWIGLASIFSSLIESHPFLLTNHPRTCFVLRCLPFMQWPSTFRSKQSVLMMRPGLETLRSSLIIRSMMIRPGGKL